MFFACLLQHNKKTVNTDFGGSSLKIAKFPTIAV